MNYESLFDYCQDLEETTNNTIYYIGNKIENSLSTIAIDNNTHKIQSYSNEWLSLLKMYHLLKRPLYNQICNDYNNIIQRTDLDITYSNYNVIPFITAFSTGTIHGYAGLYSILDIYINNYDKYKDYNIIIYKDSQQGLLDIINHFVNKNIIKKEKLIYISSNIKYLFKSIKFIPVKFIIYPRHILKFDLIDNYIIEKDNLTPLENDKICIIKNTSSVNVTNNGLVDNNNVVQFCNNNKLLLIDPSQMNEIELIRLMNKSRVFITSWGTAFFKNYVYLSDKCEKIIVLVIGGFIHQYNNESRNLIKKYKNAIVYYHIIDEKLDLILDI